MPLREDTQAARAARVAARQRREDRRAAARRLGERFASVGIAISVYDSVPWASADQQTLEQIWGMMVDIAAHPGSAAAFSAAWTQRADTRSEQ